VVMLGGCVSLVIVENRSFCRCIRLGAFLYLKVEAELASEIYSVPN
jgi:hypothetical protein